MPKLYVQKIGIMTNSICHYVQFIYFKSALFNSYVTWKLILFCFKIHYSWKIEKRKEATQIIIEMASSHHHSSICSSTSRTFRSSVFFISSITEVMTPELEVLNSLPAASLKRITELRESAPIWKV